VLQKGIWHDVGMPAPWTLLALPPLDVALLEGLFVDLPVEVVVPADRSPAAVREVAGAAEIVLGDWTGGVAITAEVVSAAPLLAFVHQPSVGVDSVDVGACTAAGVPLANAGDSNVISVSEWCVGATFAALRSLAYADHEVRAGQWPQLTLAQRGGGELSGRRVGVIGMGRIGRACAERFGALGCDVAHWSRTRRDAADAGGAPWLALDDLLRRSDVLVVVIARAPETLDLLGAEQLALLPAGAFLVNASRGGIVAEDALLAAVQSGALAGGALDVYATEPLPADSPLRDEDRLLLSPHAAGATRQAQSRLIAALVDNIGRAVSGQPVRNVVNGVDAVIRRREG
jgi:D-3-phosphoglycerate dehydrogenase / 2-oxoglutarate reductase